VGRSACLAHARVDVEVVQLGFACLAADDDDPKPLPAFGFEGLQAAGFESLQLTFLLPVTFPVTFGLLQVLVPS
jgi:hypothetical protein